LVRDVLRGSEGRPTERMPTPVDTPSRPTHHFNTGGLVSLVI